MANNKGTKRTLITSLLVILLCFSMLVGTTFAWFTDSTASIGNVIKSGRLDVKMSYSSDNVNFTDVEADDATPIFNYDKWEPGYTEMRYIKLENIGTLAFMWQLHIVQNGEITDLIDVIDVYVAEVDSSFDHSKVGLHTDVFKRAGNLAEMIAENDGAAHGALLSKLTTATPDSYERKGEVTICIALHMREDAGNEYQNKSVASDFGIQVVAKQYTEEVDSFNDQYDKDTIFPAKAIGGWQQLVDALANNEDVVLLNDIDLADVDWTPIAQYSGTFDGNGFAIKNLKGENGLFDNLNGATVKNLTLENVDINATTTHTGALAGYITKTPGKQTVIDNITVSGTVNGSSYYVGGVIGADSNYDTVITNCTNNATIVAPGQQVGGIIGYATRGTLVEDCVNNGDITGGSFVGGIIGMAAGDDDMPELCTTVKNCVNTGAVAETALDPAVTWQGGVGGIIGNIGRAAGDPAVVELNFYIINCTVEPGQSVYGQKHNVYGGHDTLLNVVVE